MPLLRKSEESDIVTDAAVDPRGLLPLGGAGATPDRRKHVESTAGGVLSPAPAVSVPEPEAAPLTDPGLRRRLLSGLEQAAAGTTHDLGDFAQFLARDHPKGWGGERVCLPSRGVR
ncbi:hypothetical protein [Actinacidiphila yeochonensis]|uniref:hypothetical protein n=1 Tax=Actinacidiphila yeochonensis TaxID=89050 RepID=UPI00068E9FBD|nr:hypothetical protein [Actinacidiphila yeochonensis]